MEVILDFNEELAKKIKDEIIAGSFITDNGINVEFTYISDSKGDMYPFLFIKEVDHDIFMWADKYGICKNGYFIKIKCDVRNAFKDGDVLFGSVGTFLYNGVINEEQGLMGCHCALLSTGDITYKENYDRWAWIKNVRFATENERRIFINKLMDSKSDKAKDLLKSYFKNEMFDDETKNLKPFDKVLVKSFDQDEWNISLFHEVKENGEDTVYKCLNGVEWDQCIPYEGNEYLLDK